MHWFAQKRQYSLPESPQAVVQIYALIEKSSVRRIFWEPAITGWVYVWKHVDTVFDHSFYNPPPLPQKCTSCAVLEPPHTSFFQCPVPVFTPLLQHPHVHPLLLPANPAWPWPGTPPTKNSKNWFIRGQIQFLFVLVTNYCCLNIQTVPLSSCNSVLIS